MCYTNSTHVTPFKTSITSSTMYSTPLLAELGDKVSVQRPCDTRHHKRNTWHLAIWHQVWIRQRKFSKFSCSMKHQNPSTVVFWTKKTSEIQMMFLVWRRKIDMCFFLGGEAVFFLGWSFGDSFTTRDVEKKLHACQVHQCLHGQIRLQQSDPLQAHTHCATKSLASAVKPTKRPLLSGACGIMTLQKLRSQIPITPENMQEERNLISLCKSTVGKVAACLFYGIFFDFFGRHLQ